MPRSTCRGSAPTGPLHHKAHPSPVKPPKPPSWRLQHGAQQHPARAQRCCPTSTNQQHADSTFWFSGRLGQASCLQNRGN